MLYYVDMVESSYNMGKTIGLVVRSDPRIKLGILFGSAAEDKLRPDSDLDIGLAAEKPLTSTQKKRLIERFALATARPIDLIDLRVAGTPLLARILSTGRLIHCANRRLYAELIKKMLYQQTDFAPYRERILKERRKAWIGH